MFLLKVKTDKRKLDVIFDLLINSEVVFYILAYIIISLLDKLQ